MEFNDPATDRPRFHLDMISGSEATRQLSMLLDTAFQVPAGGRFLDDFPVWDEAFAPSGDKLARFGAFAGGRELAACVGTRIAELKLGKGRVKVALIGAVATRAEYRGHGLASSLVKLASEWAKTRGASAVLLWGSEHSLYRRLGFELCGSQTQVPLNELRLDSFDPVPVSRGWTPGIFRAMCRRSTGLALDSNDEGWLSAHRNVQWFWIGDREDPKAYAAMGRGIDLQNIVHEWGGERGHLPFLLRSLAEIFPDASILGRREQMEGIGILAPGKGQTDYLCMAKLLDPEKLYRGLHPKTPFRVTKDEAGTFRIRFGERQSPDFSELELVRVLFGPAASSFDGTLPLPLWIWGLDAV